MAAGVSFFQSRASRCKPEISVSGVPFGEILPSQICTIISHGSKFCTVTDLYSENKYATIALLRKTIMKKIEGSPKNLRQLLQNTKYSIHYYQREYMWQRKQYSSLQWVN